MSVIMSLGKIKNNKETILNLFFVIIFRQLNTNFHPPYEQGSSDQSLHGTEISLMFFIKTETNFSDCKGKVCLYNGTLDLNTCECHCSTYASGSQCEKRKYHIFVPSIIYHYSSIINS